MLQSGNIDMLRAVARFHADGSPVDPAEHHRRDASDSARMEKSHALRSAAREFTAALSHAMSLLLNAGRLKTEKIA